MNTDQSRASDIELVQLVRAGDRIAFSRLMERHQRHVYRIVRHITGNHDDADEVSQETFVRAYLGLGDFRNDSTFSTWLYRISVNLSLNAIRRKQIMAYLRESELLSRFLPKADTGHRPAEERRANGLDAALAGLPEKQRLVFVLRYLEGLPYEEISEILKTSVGGLRASYSHAVRKISEYAEQRASGHSMGPGGETGGRSSEVSHLPD